MKLSIITVCFNAENTIEKTIKSILEQTSTEFEWVVVDGKSTDTTNEIIKKYLPEFECKGVKVNYCSENDKRNICEPASVSCSPCRNSLPCKQALRVTNIYVLSLCVFSFQSLSSARILSSSFTSVSVSCRTAA